MIQTLVAAAIFFLNTNFALAQTTHDLNTLHSQLFSTPSLVHMMLTTTKNGCYVYAGTKYHIETTPIQFRIIDQKARLAAELRLPRAKELWSAASKERRRTFYKILASEANKRFPSVGGNNILYVSNKTGTEICVGYKAKKDGKLDIFMFTSGQNPTGKWSACDKSLLPKKMQSSEYIWLGQKIEIAVANIKSEKNQCEETKNDLDN